MSFTDSRRVFRSSDVNGGGVKSRVILVLVIGCLIDFVSDSSPDAVHDAVPDAGPDAVPDAGPDAARCRMRSIRSCSYANFVSDSSPDAVPDAVPDAGPDAVPDAVPNAFSDAAPDAVHDAVPDAVPQLATARWLFLFIWLHWLPPL